MLDNLVYYVSLSELQPGYSTTIDWDGESSKWSLSQQCKTVLKAIRICTMSLCSAPVLPLPPRWTFAHLNHKWGNITSLFHRWARRVNTPVIPYSNVYFIPLLVWSCLTHCRYCAHMPHTIIYSEHCTHCCKKWVFLEWIDRGGIGRMLTKADEGGRGGLKTSEIGWHNMWTAPNSNVTWYHCIC